MPDSPPFTVTVDVPLATVDVRAVDRRDAAVAVSPADPARQEDLDAAAQVQVLDDARQLSVRAPRSVRHRLFGRSGALVVQVACPVGSEVTVRTSIGDVAAAGRLGRVLVATGMGTVTVAEAADLEVTAGTGDVVVGRVTAAARIKNGSGTVTVDDVAGDTEVRNANGDTRVGRVGGRLQVKAANGDVVVNRVDGATSVRTSNGDIRLGRAAGDETVARSGHGEVEVGLPDRPVWLDLHTSFGRVTRDLAETSPPADPAGAPRLVVRTATGDITVRRAPEPPDPGRRTGEKPQ